MQDNKTANVCAHEYHNFDNDYIKIPIYVQ